MARRPPPYLFPLSMNEQSRVGKESLALGLGDVGTAARVIVASAAAASYKRRNHHDQRTTKKTMEDYVLVVWKIFARRQRKQTLF